MGVVTRSFRLSYQVVALLSINLVATLSLRSSSNSISLRVSETLFNQFLATTASTVPENISQLNVLASLINLDNLTLEVVKTVEDLS